MIRQSDSPQIDYLREVDQFSTAEQVLSFFDRFWKEFSFQKLIEIKNVSYMKHMSIYSHTYNSCLL